MLYFRKKAFLLTIVIFSAVFFIPFSLSAKEQLYPIAGLNAEESREAAAYANYLKGIFLLFEGKADITEAAEHFRDSLILNPDNKAAMQIISRLFFDNLPMEQLAKYLQEIAEANPDHLEANILYGNFLFITLEHDKAERHLIALLDKNKWNSPETLAVLFENFILRDDLDKLKKILVIAKKKKASRKDLQLKFVEAYLYFKNIKPEAEDRAISEQDKKQLNKILQPVLADLSFFEKPRMFTLGTSVLSKIEDWSNLALVLDSCSDKNKSRIYWFPLRLEAYKKLADLDGLDSFSRFALKVLDAHDPFIEMIAEAYTELKEYKKAAQIYELLHLINRESLSVRMQLAWLYHMSEAPGKALAILAPIKELPLPGIMLKAAAHRQRGENDKSLKIYQDAEKNAFSGQEPIELAGDFFLMYAFAAESLGNLELCLEKLRKAYSINPENPSICNALGYTLADKNMELKFAEELIEKAVRKENDNIAFLDSLAWVKYRLNKKEEALQAAVKIMPIIDSDPDPDGVIFEHLSKILNENNYKIIAEFYAKMRE